MSQTLSPLENQCDLHWQVLNEGQAVKLAQLTGKHRGAAAALCAEVAGARPARSAPARNMQRRRSQHAEAWPTLHSPRYRVTTSAACPVSQSVL